MRVYPEHGVAKSAQYRCRQKLYALLLSKLGGGESIPKVIKEPEELIWLDLDHRGGFILAQIDGTSTIEEIIAVAGMDPLESYQILVELQQQKVIKS